MFLQKLDLVALVKSIEDINAASMLLQILGVSIGFYLSLIKMGICQLILHTLERICSLYL